MGVRYIDEVDLKILSKLVQDSRIPFSRLARELGVSESTIYLRIKKLRKLGVLKSFSAIVDLSRLGYEVEAFIKVKIGNQRSPMDVAEVLEKIGGIMEIYEVSGEYPILVKVVARNNLELSGIIDSVMKVRGVTDIDVMYVIRRIATETYPQRVSPAIEKLLK
ncbi:MAG: Lrp/AsnC family transcriptional regulator [Desulfurococcales archaeon]|nr:Lrp/AsnC family transcriptional regulator [Desulfurococcales archaeon]